MLLEMFWWDFYENLLDLFDDAVAHLYIAGCFCVFYHQKKIFITDFEMDLLESFALFIS